MHALVNPSTVVIQCTQIIESFELESVSCEGRPIVQCQPTVSDVYMRTYETECQ